MAVRFIMVFILAVAITGCLKKAADESIPAGVSVTEESAMDIAADSSQEPQEVMQGKNVSVKPADTQTAAFEKPSIHDIQKALKSANLYHGNIDGIIGPNTKKAIEAFQSQNSLKADGKVGPKTWQKLKEYLVK